MTLDNFIIFCKRFISDIKKYGVKTDIKEYETFLHSVGDIYVDNWTVEQYLGDLTIFVRGEYSDLPYNKRALDLLITLSKDFFYRYYIREIRVSFLYYSPYNRRDKLKYLSERIRDIESF